MSIFKVQLDEALGRLATAPTRRHGGTRLRSSIALQSPIELLHTESKVLPESDQEAGIHRAEDGSLKPTKTSGLANSFKLKLQDPTHLKSFVDFGRRLPSRGVGATKLLLSAAAERRGRKATKAAMLAGPMLVNAREPRGIAKTRRLPTLNVRTNVVFIDENADVTFGVTAYPAWVRSSDRDAPRAIARMQALLCRISRWIPSQHATDRPLHHPMLPR